AQRGRSSGRKVLEQGNRRAVPALHQEPRSGLAPPGVWVGEERNQRCGSRALEPRTATTRAGTVMNQVVEAAAILPAGQVEVLLDRFGDRPRMLDRLTVHI